jgi:hypothetical protein
MIFFKHGARGPTAESIAVVRSRAAPGAAASPHEATHTIALLLPPELEPHVHRRCEAQCSQPTGEPEMLAGRNLHKMGDRVQHAPPRPSRRARSAASGSAMERKAGWAELQAGACWRRATWSERGACIACKVMWCCDDDGTRAHSFSSTRSPASPSLCPPPSDHSPLNLALLSPTPTTSLAPHIRPFPCAFRTREAEAAELELEFAPPAKNRKTAGSLSMMGLDTAGFHRPRTKESRWAGARAYVEMLACLWWCWWWWWCVCVCKHIHIYIHVYIYMYLYIYVCICVHVSVCVSLLTVISSLLCDT